VTVGDRYLRAGTRYIVRFDDCCVAGEFEDTFVRYELDPDDPEDPTAAIFEHGRVELTGRSNYEFIEVEVT
jgi:hypothetical protein